MPRQVNPTASEYIQSVNYGRFAQSVGIGDALARLYTFPEAPVIDWKSIEGEARKSSGMGGRGAFDRSPVGRGSLPWNFPLKRFFLHLRIWGLSR